MTEEPLSSARLYVLRGCDGLASAVASYAVPLLVLLTTGSPALTGVAFAVEWAPRLAAFTVAGTLSERHRPARVLFATGLLRALVVIAAAFVLAFSTSQTVALSTVLVLGAVAGLLNEVGYVASETLSADSSRRGGGHRTQAAMTSIDQGTALAAPVCGGVALLGGATPLLVLVAVLSLATAWAAPAPREATVKFREVAPPAGGLAAGWRTLRAVPALLWLVGGLAVSNAATGIVQAGAPIMVVDRFGLSFAHIGVLWSVAACAALGVVWLVQRVIGRWGVWPAGVLCATTCTSGCLAVALAPSFLSYAVAVAVMMAAEGGLTVVLRTLRSRLLPASGFASALSVSIICGIAPLPLVGLLVGAVPPARLGILVTVGALLQAACLTGAFWRLRPVVAGPDHVLAA